ncbi:MAG: death-on-curing protein [Rubritalea sp.]|jgi:death-on-curing protein
MDPLWISLESCVLIHDKSLSNFGGADGVRDQGLLESALSRPQQLHHYEQATLHQLAASYAFGIIKNHPFIDGNKRTGFIASALFLQMNGHRLIATEEKALHQTVALAASAITEQQYAQWLSTSCKEI